MEEKATVYVIAPDDAVRDSSQLLIETRRPRGALPYVGRELFAHFPEQRLRVDRSEPARHDGAGSCGAFTTAWRSGADNRHDVRGRPRDELCCRAVRGTPSRKALRLGAVDRSDPNGTEPVIPVSLRARPHSRESSASHLAASPVCPDNIA